MALNQELHKRFLSGKAQQEAIEAQPTMKIVTLRERYKKQGRLDKVLPSLFPGEPSKRIQELARHRNVRPEAEPPRFVIKFRKRKNFDGKFAIKSQRKLL